MSDQLKAHRIYQPALLPAKKITKKQTGFQHLFTQELHSLNVSKHAQKRLQERKITIQPEKWLEIAQKVQEAGQKGINDSLVLLKDVALVVNAPNHTVITAVDRKEASAQIFTNINGAILLDD